MTASGLHPAESAAMSLRRWTGSLGGILALLVSLVLIGGSPVAAFGVAIIGLLTLWLLADYSSAAICVAPVSLLIPSGVALYFGPDYPLLTFQRAMLALLVVGALFHVPARFLGGLWTTPRIRLLLGMVLALAVATALSTEPSVSQREFFSERGIGLPLYFAAVWLALRDEVTVRRLLWALVAVALVIVVTATVESVTGKGAVGQLGLLPPEKLQALGYQTELERRVGLPRVQSVFQHPLQLGAFLVILIPMVAVLRRHAATIWARAWCGVTLILALVALVFTWSRGAWIALLFAVLFHRGSFRRWLLAAVGAAAFVLVWWNLGFLRPITLVYRWWLVRGVSRAVLGHYGLGTGPGTFVRNVVVNVAGTSQRTGVDQLAYSLTMAIEAGPIFVILLWLFVLGFLRDAGVACDHALALGRQETADVLNALRAGVLANLILSLFSTSVFGTTTGLFISLMILAAIGRLSRFELASATVIPEQLSHADPT